MAGEQIQVGEAILKLVLDLENMQKGIAEGKAKMDGFVSEAKTGLNAYRLAWGGAILAVGSFVLKSISEYGKLDRAISTVVNSAKAYGIATDNLRGKVDAYLDSLEAATRFQDTELAASLNEILGKTKDLGQAMFLNNLAADLSVRRGVPLQQAAEMLGNLYAGNTRGLMMVAKELGITGDKAQDAAFLFDELRKNVEGAAKAEADQEVTLKKLGTEYGNVSEKIGQALSGLTKWTLKLAALPAKMFNEVFASGPEKVTRDLKDATAQMETFQKLHDSAPTVAFYKESLEYWKKQVQLLGESKAKLDSLNQSQGDEGRKIREKIRADQEAATAKKQMLEDSKEIFEAEQKAIEAEIEAADRLEEQYRQIGRTLGGVVTNEMTKFFETVIEGNASLADSFAALGKSMAKGILDSIATMIEGWAAEAYAQAIISAISEDYAGAAAAAAGGVALSASAAGVRAMGNKLAKGGFVSGGRTDQDTVNATLRKNEAVVPLDDPRALREMSRAMGKAGGASQGGSNYYQISVSVPGARPEVAASAAYELGKAIDKKEQRQGRRGGRTRS